MVNEEYSYSHSQYLCNHFTITTTITTTLMIHYRLLLDDSVLTISIAVYALGFVVNGYVSGSLYKQAFFPRTSPGWQSVMVKGCFAIPCK